MLKGVRGKLEGGYTRLTIRIINSDSTGFIGEIIESNKREADKDNPYTIGKTFFWTYYCWSKIELLN